MTQIEYITILFDDLHYTTKQRHDWLFQRMGHLYADELTAGQRGLVIGVLKQEKEDRNDYTK